MIRIIILILICVTAFADYPPTPVTGTFFQSVQPISGTVVAIPAGGSTWPVSFTPSASQSVTQSTNPWVIASQGYANGVTTVPAGGSTWPVSGAFYQTTQPVSIDSMPSTPVTGTFFQSVQPVSGSGNFSTVPASNSTWPVSGTFWQSSQPVTGNFFQTTQPVSYAGGSTIPVSLAVAPTTPVTGTFFQSIQPISGSVSGSGNFSTVPASNSTWPVSIASMPSTPVTGSFFQSIQPVSGSGNFSTVPASNSTWPVSLASAPVTPVTGSFFQTTQPVSYAGGSTIPVSIATMPSTPVTGSFFQSTQPVSYAGASTIPVSLANTYRSATMTNGSGDLDTPCEGMGGAIVSITGTWTGTITFQASLDGVTFTGLGSVPANGVDLQLLNNGVPVSTTASGTFSFSTSGYKTLRMHNTVSTGSATVSVGAGIGPRVIDAILSNVFVNQAGTWTVQPGNTANTTAWKVDNSAVVQPATLGTTTGKTNIAKNGRILTSTTADAQSVLSYTTTTNKTFYINYLSMEGNFNAVSATGSSLGTIYFVPPVGQSIAHVLMNPTTSASDRVVYTFSEPMVSASASTAKILVRPASTTPTIWQGNFGGYEK